MLTHCGGTRTRMATATSNPAGTRHSTADPLVRAVRSVEESTALDPAVHLVDPVAEALVDSPEVRKVSKIGRAHV